MCTIDLQSRIGIYIPKDTHRQESTPIDMHMDFDLSLQLYGNIIFHSNFRQLIQNNQFRTRHCAHTNVAIQLKSGESCQ